jgi:hypothetical protein
VTKTISAVITVISAMSRLQFGFIERNEKSVSDRNEEKHNHKKRKADGDVSNQLHLTNQKSALVNF